MKRETAISLTRRLLDCIENKTLEMSEAMQVEQAAIFLDAVRFEKEKQQFFLESPQVIGFAGELSQPGSYIATEVAGVPVVVSRDQDKQIHAFVNACAHRGARVAENGFGVKKRLTCNYHGWSYGLDGQLAGRPMDFAFDPPGAETCLKKLPVSLESGLVVVAVSDAVSQHEVDHFLDDLTPELSGLNLDQVYSIDTRRIEVNANWKLVTGLSHESYHFASLHRDSLAPLMFNNSIYDRFGNHTRFGFPMKSILELKDLPEEQWPDRPPAVFNHTLFPGTVFVSSPKSAQLIRTEPGDSPGTSVVYYSGVGEVPEEAEENRFAWNFGGDIFEKEDLGAAIQAQQGLQAGQPTVIFGRNEPVVQIWHQIWDELLQL